MYFINKGIVVLLQQSSQTFIYELKSNEYFGEISFFSGLPRTVSARTLAFTEMLFINSENFIEVCKEYSEEYEHFTKLK